MDTPYLRRDTPYLRRRITRIQVILAPDPDSTSDREAIAIDCVGDSGLCSHALWPINEGAKCTGSRNESKNPTVRVISCLERYLSASQKNWAIGLRNGRGVGAGCGRRIASIVQIVWAAWRHSLAS